MWQHRHFQMQNSMCNRQIHMHICVCVLYQQTGIHRHMTSCMGDCHNCQRHATCCDMKCGAFFLFFLVFVMAMALCGFICFGYELLSIFLLFIHREWQTFFGLLYIHSHIYLFGFDLREFTSKSRLAHCCATLSLAWGCSFFMLALSQYLHICVSVCVYIRVDRRWLCAALNPILRQLFNRNAVNYTRINIRWAPRDAETKMCRHHIHT